MNTTRISSIGRWLLACWCVAGFVVACSGSASTLATPTAIATIAPPAAPTMETQRTETEPTSEPPATPEVAVINVGVNAQFKPFVYYDEEDRLAGFDVDLVNALAQAGQFEFGFVDLAFEELLSAVENGEVDAAISAITITPERQERIDFTEPYFGQSQDTVSYFSGGQGLAVGIDNTNITGTTALTPETIIGVKTGTTGAAFVASETPAQAVEFPEAEPALEALSNGEVDAVVLDVPVIVHYIKSHPDAGVKLAGPPMTEEQYGIAVTKAKPEVLALLNQALAQIREDGTYDAIYQKWFGAP
jgi:polar amino acid transport system substrate-binding protein